jgi:hypothetical protein
MYTLLQNKRAKTIVKKEMPSLLISLFVTEIFCRFGSFALECTVFIAIWVGLSYLINSFISLVEKSGKKNHIPLQGG